MLDRQFLPFHLFLSSEHLPLSLLRIVPILLVLFSLGSDESDFLSALKTL